jgi:FtsZ-binding cell division protein ZapB
MGKLKLKESVTPISRRLFNESPRENIFAIKAAGAEFFKPPTEGKYKIIGCKTPHGYDKQLIPRLDRDDLEPDESIFSTPTSGMRHRKPPAIRGPPGQFEDSDEDSEDEDPYEGLRNEIAELKMKNNLLEEHVDEAELRRMEIDDKMEILRKAICNMFRRLSKELGRPDL